MEFLSALFYFALVQNLALVHFLGLSPLRETPVALPALKDRLLGALLYFFSSSLLLWTLQSFLVRPLGWQNFSLLLLTLVFLGYYLLWARLLVPRWAWAENTWKTLGHPFYSVLPLGAVYILGDFSWTQGLVALLGAYLGYLFFLTGLGYLRGRMRFERIPQAFVHWPLTLLSSGLVAMVLMVLAQSFPQGWWTG